MRVYEDFFKIEKTCKAKNISWPPEVKFSLGVNLAPKGELCPLVGFFTLHSLLGVNTL
jgi:hypothetical protein